MKVKFQSSVLLVRDIKQSRAFYEELLGQQVEADFGVNVGYAGGFAIWQVDHAHQTIFGQPRYTDDQLGHSNCELYFEVEAFDTAWKRISPAARIAHPIMEQPWGQRVFRIYDPDGHIIEIAEPMPVLVRRLARFGNSADDIAKRTGLPVEGVEMMLGEMLVAE